MNILPLFFATNVFFYLIFALITGITGIIVLIIGISRRKTHVWITSIILMLVAIVFGITSIITGVRVLLNNPDYLRDKEYSYRWFNDKGRSQHHENFTDDIPVEKYKSEVKAVIVDYKGVEENVKVLARKRLSRKGIGIEDLIIKNEITGSYHNVVFLKLTFSKSFRGYLHLKAFDESREGIAKSTIEFDVEDTLDLELEFGFDRDISLSEIDYCTLSSENL